MNTKWINIFHVANLEKKNAEQTRTQSKVLVNGAAKVSIFHGTRQEMYKQSNIMTNLNPCILICALGCYSITVPRY